jgi:hypothetical protein
MNRNIGADLYISNNVDPDAQIYGRLWITERLSG